MNVVLTLPNHLLSLFLSGQKTAELRKSFPTKLNVGKEGFFFIEKGTDSCYAWCRVKSIVKFERSSLMDINTLRAICVSDRWVSDYREGAKCSYVWYVDKVVRFKYPMHRGYFFLNHNPQSFAYAPSFSSELYSNY